MTTWHDFLDQTGSPPEWPYPLRYEEERQIEADVLVVGGGIAGCWAAISAARAGVKVALVEKGNTVRSGQAGSGCDHWETAPANPHSKVDPDDWALRMVSLEGDNQWSTEETGANFGNRIGDQITCRESYDTLLELEQMGGKVRDTDDAYVGAEGRHDDTKLMLCPRRSPNHSTETVLRVWGTTFKPALKKECQRLGVEIHDRVMVTRLLTEDGVQGGRVIGAVGVNNRTGEFLVFKAKATILATAGGSWSLWMLNTESAGYVTVPSRTQSGDGIAMAWKAGAELTLMEWTSTWHRDLNGTGMRHSWYGGAGDVSHEGIALVDAAGKRVPWPIQGWEDGGEFEPPPQEMQALQAALGRGEFQLPFYGDFPGTADVERRVAWGLMIGEEAITRVIRDSYGEAGFDPARHQLLSYKFIEGSGPSWLREPAAGGLMVDWDLKSTLDGLYVAGEQMFCPEAHSYAAATGRYAGRKAADYARQIAPPQASKEQVAREKARIYAPVKRSRGIEWKELHAGIARVMQYFCSDFKSRTTLQMGLDALNEIEAEFVPRLYALDPHKLMRGLEDLSMLTHAQIIMQASLARKASSGTLGFHRTDYPEVDPPEWNRHVTVALENDQVKVGEVPLDYAGDMKQNYESHNRDYTGVCQ